MLEGIRQDTQVFVVNVTVLTDSSKSARNRVRRETYYVYVWGRRAVLGSGAHRSLLILQLQ